MEKGTMDQWAVIRSTFVAGRLCTTCPHHHEWDEWHPYAAGRAKEPLRECLVLNGGKSADECPATKGEDNAEQ